MQNVNTSKMKRDLCITKKVKHFVKTNHQIDISLKPKTVFYSETQTLVHAKPCKQYKV